MIALDNCPGGSFIGSHKSCNDYMNETSMDYMLKKLTTHNWMSPKSMYKSFTIVFQQNLTFIGRITPNSDSLLRETKKSDKNLISSMLKQPSYNDKYQKVFSHLVRDGGLSILLPEDKVNEYQRTKIRYVSRYRITTL